MKAILIVFLGLSVISCSCNSFIAEKGRYKRALNETPLSQEELNRVNEIVSCYRIIEIEYDPDVFYERIIPYHFLILEDGAHESFVLGVYFFGEKVKSNIRYFRNYCSINFSMEDKKALDDLIVELDGRVPGSSSIKIK